MLTLDKIEPGTMTRIVSNKATGNVRRRIMDMGLLPGESLEMVRRAPLGDPLEVVVKGYHLSLRKSEARFIEVEVPE
ncbi:MAG: FeoA family protein [Candidatus Methanomethylophilaceae archaeon]|jgi:ferrous iron transport protein A|nr:FeoA family protein [Candidatus Methanomethylophilaceae archaeon]